MPNVTPQPLLLIQGPIVQLDTEYIEPRPAQPATPPSVEFPQGRPGRAAFEGLTIPRVSVMVEAALMDKPAEGLTSCLSIRCTKEELDAFTLGEVVALKCRAFSILSGKPGGWYNVVDYQFVARAEDSAVAGAGRRKAA